jgi:hypothetical protein
VDVGQGQAHTEMARAWHDVAGIVRPHGSGVIGRAPSPVHAELQALRAEPGGQAYIDRLARHGGREYTGGPVSWETGRPLRRTAA